LFFKSAAKRNATPPTTAPAAPAAAAAAPLTIESLGQQLREVLPTRRLQSISLCDHEANVLWLSEGALGPDEHSMVTEALALLSADTSLPCHETGLEDGRLALFLPVRAPNGEPVGIAMILADRKSVSDDTLERMTAAPVRAIMQRLAVLLKPSERRASGSTARLPMLQLADEPEVAAAVPPAARVAPVAAAAAPVAPPAGPAAAPIISPEEIDDILEFDLTAEALAPAPRQEIPAMPPIAAVEPEEPEFDAAPGASADPPDMLDLDFEPALPKGPAARGTVRTPAPVPAPVAPRHPRRRLPGPRVPASHRRGRPLLWYPSRPRLHRRRRPQHRLARRWPPSPATRTSCSSCCRT
jgi:hypothetical protein